jgi:hypothetical protein
MHNPREKRRSSLFFPQDLRRLVPLRSRPTNVPNDGPNTKIRQSCSPDEVLEVSQVHHKLRAWCFIAFGPYPFAICF